MISRDDVGGSWALTTTEFWMSFVVGAVEGVEVAVRAIPFAVVDGSGAAVGKTMVPAVCDSEDGFFSRDVGKVWGVGDARGISVAVLLVAIDDSAVMVGGGGGSA